MDLRCSDTICFQYITNRRNRKPLWRVGSCPIKSEQMSTCGHSRSTYPTCISLESSWKMMSFSSDFLGVSPFLLDLLGFLRVHRRLQRGRLPRNLGRCRYGRTNDLYHSSVPRRRCLWIFACSDLLWCPRFWWSGTSGKQRYGEGLRRGCQFDPTCYHLNQTASSKQSHPRFLCIRDNKLYCHEHRLAIKPWPTYGNEARAE